MGAFAQRIESAWKKRIRSAGARASQSHGSVRNCETSLWSLNCVFGGKYRNIICFDAIARLRGMEAGMVVWVVKI